MSLLIQTPTVSRSSYTVRNRHVVAAAAVLSVVKAVQTSATLRARLTALSAHKGTLTTVMGATIPVGLFGRVAMHKAPVFSRGLALKAALAAARADLQAACERAYPHN